MLRRVLELYEAEGWKPVVAPEMEFYLVARNTDPHKPLQPAGGPHRQPETARQAYSIDAVNDFDPFFEDVYDFCEKMELDVDTLIHEVGAGQMEINFSHGDPLDLADRVFLFKRTVRETALRHDIFATFMAKPMDGEPGSAMHVHQSILCTRPAARTSSATPTAAPSQEFFTTSAGCRSYIPAAMALFAPYVNSYRRLSRFNAAPINIQWGNDNRTVRHPLAEWPARRPGGSRTASSAPTPTPMWRMAATLACGYLGMKNKVKPIGRVQGRRLPGAVFAATQPGRGLELLRDANGSGRGAGGVRRRLYRGQGDSSTPSS